MVDGVRQWCCRHRCVLYGIFGRLIGPYYLPQCRIWCHRHSDCQNLDGNYFGRFAYRKRPSICIGAYYTEALAQLRDCMPEEFIPSLLFFVAFAGLRSNPCTISGWTAPSSGSIDKRYWSILASLQPFRPLDSADSVDFGIRQ